MTQSISSRPTHLSTVAWAQGYARLGWRIFPVRAREKRPMYSGWQKDATTDPRMVDQYWAHAQDRNIGVVCGEAFDAWDIEFDHVAALTEWMTENGHVFPEAPLARTGRGGMHYLTQPTGYGHTAKLYLGDRHIGELKSTGGFIVVAPSRTEGQYLWEWAPYGMELPPAPQWLQNLVRRPNLAARPVSWQKASLSPQTDIVPLLEAVRGSHAGNRNAMLHWAANRACDDGISETFATRELMAAFIEVSKDDENRQEREHEAWATIRSAYNR